MEIMAVSGEIELAINQIRDEIKKLIPAADKKSKAAGNYDKVIALKMLALRNGKDFVFEGEVIKDLPATLIDKIARGMCYQEKINAEMAEAEYKIIITTISALESILNGNQSLFRWLDKT